MAGQRHGTNAAAGAAAGPPGPDHDFYMFQYKTLPCHVKRVHEWKNCCMVHEGEKARRRDPRLHAYSPEPCPDFMRTGACCHGDACPLAHGVFETWLHPLRFRTVMCADGGACRRRRGTCWFAHSVAELRHPEAAAAGGQALPHSSISSMQPPALAGVCSQQRPHASSRLNSPSAARMGAASPTSSYSGSSCSSSHAAGSISSSGAISCSSSLSAYAAAAAAAAPPPGIAAASVPPTAGHPQHLQLLQPTAPGIQPAHFGQAGAALPRPLHVSAPVPALARLLAGGGMQQLHCSVPATTSMAHCGGGGGDDALMLFPPSSSSCKTTEPTATAAQMSPPNPAALQALLLSLQQQALTTQQQVISAHAAAATASSNLQAVLSTIGGMPLAGTAGGLGASAGMVMMSPAASLAPANLPQPAAPMAAASYGLWA